VRPTGRCKFSAGQRDPLATLAAVRGALELVAMWVRGELNVTREHLTEFITSAIVTVAIDMTRTERS
jgi:hypothetical protein